MSSLQLQRIGFLRIGSYTKSETLTASWPAMTFDLGHHVILQVGDLFLAFKCREYKWTWLKENLSKG